MKKIIEMGYIEKGTGKRQSNVVYSAGEGRSYLDCGFGCQSARSEDNRYALCNQYSYCIDANYAKGTSFEEYLRKHRRQLIIEQYD